jgi:CheY-like chemotaxis protein
MSSERGYCDAVFRERLSERLRQPLNAIIGFSELFAMRPNSIHGLSDVKRILKGARDLLAIVDEELTNPGKKSTTPAATEAIESCDIVYIEDDIANFTLVERILELREGLKVKHASSGRAGLELVMSTKPRLVLLDLNLPDIHGSEILQILQSNAQTASLPVVILSAAANSAQIERLLAAGARNYLTKPFDIDHFLTVVDEFIGNASPTPRIAA